MTARVFVTMFIGLQGWAHLQSAIERVMSKQQTSTKANIQQNKHIIFFCSPPAVGQLLHVPPPRRGINPQVLGQSVESHSTEVV